MDNSFLNKFTLKFKQDAYNVEWTAKFFQQIKPIIILI